MRWIPIAEMVGADFLWGRWKGFLFGFPPNLLLRKISSEGVSPELRELHLSWNKLTGRLSEWLSQLEKLTILDLEDNKFQGTIPASFRTFQNLERMWLA